MAFIYFLSTIGVLLVFADKVPAAVSMIFEKCFYHHGGNRRFPWRDCHDGNEKRRGPRGILQ